MSRTTTREEQRRRAAQRPNQSRRSVTQVHPLTPSFEPETCMSSPASTQEEDEAWESLKEAEASKSLMRARKRWRSRYNRSVEHPPHGPRDEAEAWGSLGRARKRRRCQDRSVGHPPLAEQRGSACLPDEAEPWGSLGRARKRRRCQDRSVGHPPRGEQRGSTCLPDEAEPWGSLGRARKRRRCQDRSVGHPPQGEQRGSTCPSDEAEDEAEPWGSLGRARRRRRCGYRSVGHPPLGDQPGSACPAMEDVATAAKEVVATAAKEEGSKCEMVVAAASPSVTAKKEKFETAEGLLGTSLCFIAEDFKKDVCSSGLGLVGTSLALIAEEYKEDRSDSASVVPSALEKYIPSSPIRIPYLPRRVIGTDSSGKETFESELDIDPKLFDAYLEEKEKYFQKLDLLKKLPTMDKRGPVSHITPAFHPIREDETRMVLEAAKYVVGLSASFDGEVKHCSGILIDWSEGVGTILTSAYLMCSKYSIDEWSGKREYALDAEVLVQFSDEADMKGQLLYCHKHYDFALISVPMVDQPDKLASFSKEVNFDQDVIVLGRDKNFNMQLSNGQVEYKGPSIFDHHHYMYINGETLEWCTGGPVLDLDGNVAGVISLAKKMAFLPSTIIEKCLHLWKTFGWVPRLQLGMKLSAIKFLDYDRVEKVCRKCKIDAGLIVEEVSGGSIAEKLGFRIGDIILSVDGGRITTTVELENILLQICKKCLVKDKKEKNCDFSADVMMCIF